MFDNWFCFQLVGHFYERGMRAGRIVLNFVGGHLKWTIEYHKFASCLAKGSVGAFLLLLH
jgi:hypothetical protein